VRDSRINLIFEGTNEILRALIALSGLQQPGERLKEIGNAFRDPLHSIGAIGSYLKGRAKRQVTKPKLTMVHKRFEKEGEAVAENVRDLGLAVERLLIKHGRSVIERQYLQERMANAVIDIYLAVAVLSRVSAALDGAGEDEAAVQWDVDCARIFVPMASRRARRYIRALRRHQDSRLTSVSEKVIESGTLAPDVM
jgi:acyl-CoA dehydrogenase family member 9